jgi:hypothetical protein
VDFSKRVYGNSYYEKEEGGPYSFAQLVCKFLIYFNSGGIIKRIGNLNSTVEKTNSQWEQIFKCRLDNYIYNIYHPPPLSRKSGK